LGPVGDPEERDEQRIRSTLADELRDAFVSVPRPRPPLTTGTGPMYDDIERALASKAADELTPEDARGARMNLWLLTPEGYHYYLPALLRMYLTSDTYVDGLGQFTFYTLVPPEEPAAATIFNERMALLDERQRHALADYVRWYLEEQSSVADRDIAALYWLS
jgi:hypothetical protein